MEAYGSEALVIATVAGPGGMSRDKINVLFLMIQMQMGGSERLVLNLARGLDRSLFAPSVAWFIEKVPLAEFQELEVPLHHIPKSRSFDLEAISRIHRIVRENRVDIINAHHFMPFFYAYYAAKIAGKAKLVYTEHSDSDVERASGLWRGVGTCLLRNCDAAIGVSSGVSEKLRNYFRMRPERVVTIENGVTSNQGCGGREERERLRRSLGFSTTDIVIGIVANLKRNKNHLFLLEAFKELARLRRDVQLAIVGQAFPGDAEASEQAIRDYIRSEGLECAVRLMGYRRDVPDVLRALDLFCLVSHKEGLPISLIEAMAAGLPVIGTDIDGIRGVIVPDVNGLTVALGDVAGLANALGRLIADARLRRRMGEASRLMANERYSLQRCIDETAALFRSVLRA